MYRITVIHKIRIKSTREKSFYVHKYFEMLCKYPLKYIYFLATMCCGKQEFMC